MGTGFTVDSPMKVARYGISSVISLGDDGLLEKVGRHYARAHGFEYRTFGPDDPDARAHRITEYLNLVSRIVSLQTESLRGSAFEGDSEISKYYELLDDACALKSVYGEYRRTDDPLERARVERLLRRGVAAGAIDVNIMTKADRENSRGGERLPREFSDALSALRGFARSDLHSSVVFSAGLNLTLYGYAAEFDDFIVDRDGLSKKTITLKVSDLRSAFVQAKIFARKGVWVSEWRVESGLNCGGHAFPTDGRLLGPALEEILEKREEMVDSLFEIYRHTLRERRGIDLAGPPPVRLTVQGGVGTHREHRFLSRHFGVDSVGWGSPLLLVPEATTVDDETLRKLVRAGEEDIYLSGASPLGVPFYTLRDSASETERRRRIEAGNPGSPCYNHYLAFNTEFGKPLCTASREYQRRKIGEIEAGAPGDAARDAMIPKVLEKACICRELGDGVLLKYDLEGENRTLSPAVCPGPNLAYFSRVASLVEMIGHIYGRADLLGARQRPHMFLKELGLYIRYLADVVKTRSRTCSEKDQAYVANFKTNLLAGIEYYRGLAVRLHEETGEFRESFRSELDAFRRQVELICLPAPQPAAS